MYDGFYDCHVGAQHDDGVTPNVRDDGQPLDDAAQQQDCNGSQYSGQVYERQGGVVGVEVEEVLVHVGVVQHDQQQDACQQRPSVSYLQFKEVQLPVQEIARPQEG